MKIPLKHLLHVINSLLCLLFISFLSCDQSEDVPIGLELSYDWVELDFKDSVATGVTSHSDILYTVLDPFIATVNNDYIKARHVGSTKIVVSSANMRDTIEVNVRSKQKLIDYPIDSYTYGREFYYEKYFRVIIRLQTTLYFEDYDTYLFSTTNYSKDTEYFIELNFTSENTLKDVKLIFSKSLYNKVYYALIEDYEIYEYSEEKYTLINALEPTDASEIVTLSYDEDKCYVKYEQLK